MVKKLEASPISPERDPTATKPPDPGACSDQYGDSYSRRYLVDTGKSVVLSIKEQEWPNSLLETASRLSMLQQFY